MIVLQLAVCVVLVEVVVGGLTDELVVVMVNVEDVDVLEVDVELVVRILVLVEVEEAGGGTPPVALKDPT